MIKTLLGFVSAPLHSLGPYSGLSDLVLLEKRTSRTSGVLSDFAGVTLATLELGDVCPHGHCFDGAGDCLVVSNLSFTPLYHAVHP